jgi:hypothetical protein
MTALLLDGQMGAARRKRATAPHRRVAQNRFPTKRAGSVSDRVK